MQNALKNIIFLYACCVSFSSLAQMPGTKIFTLAGEYQEQPRINILYQLNKGYILLGTTMGLYNFDGINFNKISVVPDSVTAICEISTNEILLGFYNGKVGKLQNNRLHLFFPDDSLPVSKKPVTKILIDKNNTTWFATAGEGLYFSKNKRLYNINEADGLSDNFVYDISLTGSGNVIASTDNGINICTDDEKHKVLKTFTFRNGLYDNIVRCIFTTVAQDVWLGMQDGGIQYFNMETPVVLPIPPKPWQYGQVNAVTAIASRIYVATEEKGLLLFNNSSGYSLSTPEYSDERLKKISCLLKDKEGNIWAAGNNQLMRTTGSGLEPIYTFQSASPDDLHTLLYAKNGNLWFNKKQKLIQLSKSTDGGWQEHEYMIKSIAPQSDITSLFQDDNGIIWIGTMGSGLIILDPLNGKYRTITEDTLLIDGSILSISGKNGTVWIASLEGAVSLAATGAGNSINQKFLCSNYADNKNLGSKYVYDILTDSKNRIWFATDGEGVIMLDNNQFTHFNKEGSRENEVVYKIEEDNQGHFWFSTNTKGLTWFNGKQFKSYGLKEGLTDMDITSLAVSGSYLLAAHKSTIDLVNTYNGSISYLDIEQGLSNINTDPNTFTHDNKGNIYFANGYTIYRYQSSFQVQQKPSIVIDKIQLFLKDTLVQNSHSFGADENNISFFYTGLFYSQPGKIQYQYKLDGYVNEWVSTKDRVQNFPRLPSGTYTFKVRASINADFGGATEAVFTFTIQQPFFKQIWFILLTIFLIAAGLFYIIRQRESVIEKSNRLEREKIQSQLQTLRNQVNPHFLFNSFNTLISEIEENPDKAVIYVEHLSDFYRNIVVQKEKDLISLEEELRILNDYFFIQQKRYGQALQINISITPQHQKMYYVVPLALQLLFENAVKHNVISADKPLRIELFTDNEQLIIRNNISPKFQPEKGSNTGLQNIKKRYELLCGKTVVVENDEKNFTVKIPLIKQ